MAKPEFNNHRIRKNLSGSKSQADIRKQDCGYDTIRNLSNVAFEEIGVAKFDQSPTEKRHCSGIKSATKRRGSLSRTKSLLNPTSGYRLNLHNEKALSELEDQLGNPT